jgi:O-antigen ligase
MTVAAAAAPRDRLGAWCGGWLVAVAAVTPVVAWLGPMAFAPLIGLLGLACTPALRMSDDDRPAYIALLVALIWALGSTIWSPYRHALWGSTALKLVAQAVLYYAAVCGARRASPAARTLALRLLVWGMAAFGLVLLAEGLSQAWIYRTLRIAIHDEIRPDLGMKNVAHSSFVMALFLPALAVAAARVGNWWLALPMAVGLGVASHMFGADAPFLSLLLSALAALIVWRWPRIGPRVMAAGAGLFYLVAPALVRLGVASGWWETVKAEEQPSWAQRMGYWRHAADWIGDHPLRGWGLDASRMFAPGIILHPHDAALQIWLELGLIGAVAAAMFWAATLVRLSRPVRDPAVAAATAGVAVYLLFSLVSFGVWQEWWLALGAYSAVLATLVIAQPAPVARGTST